MNDLRLQSTYRDIKNLLAQSMMKVSSSDFSHGALMDAKGQLIHVEGPHPLHYFGFTQTIPNINKYFKLGPDEVVLTNDTAFGSPRLCDINFISAIYKGKEIKGYAVVQISLEDLLLTPKQFEASKIDDEGLKIPPTPLDGGGAVREALFAFLASSKIKKEKLETAFAQARYALERIKISFGELEKRWGKNQIPERLTSLQDYAEDLLKGSLHRFPDGEFSSLLKFGENQIQTKLRVRENQFVVDFSGTSKASPKAINIPYHIVLSSCFWFFMSFLDEEIPLNNGVLRAISVEAPTGSLVNPPSQSACLDGYYHTPQLIIANLKSLLSKALPQEAKDCLVAPSLSIGIKFNEQIFLENYGLGTNAGTMHTGINCVKTDFHNLPTKSVEFLEKNYPIQVISQSLRMAKEKSNAKMGGKGLSLSYKILEKGLLKILSGHHRNQQEVVILRGSAQPEAQSDEQTETHTQLSHVYQLEVGDILNITTFNGYNVGSEDSET